MSAKLHLCQVTAALCFALVSARAESLPEWLNKRSEVLPPVDEATRREVNQMLTEMRQNAPEPGSPIESLPLGYTRPAIRLVELGEKVGQSIIWNYLEEPERVDPKKLGSTAIEDYEAALMVMVSQSGEKKSEVLMRLHNDPTLVRWLLPLVRARMNWFEKAIKEGRVKEIISTSEIGGIEGYLYAHGSESDLETLNRIVSNLLEAGFGRSSLRNYLPPEKQRGEIAEIRRINKLHSRPYYQNIASVLKSYGVEHSATDESSKDTTREPLSIPTVPSLSKAAESKAIPAAATDERTSSTPWSIIVVLIVAATCLLWLLVKKRK